MEHEQNSDSVKEMNPTNQPVSFYGDNSRNTDSALLASLATRSYDYPGMISADGTSDLRHEVGELKGVIKDAEAEIRSDVRQEGQEAVGATKDAECRIVKSVGDAECALSKEILENKFAITKEVIETKHSLAKDILRSEYENKLAIQTAIKELSSKLDHESERTQDKIGFLKDFNAEKFCALSSQLQKCCCEAEVTAATQTGLLNVIANALNVGGVAVHK